MSPFLILLCSCLVTLAASETTPSRPEPYLDEHAHFHFERFIEEYNKVYADEEEKQARLEIFKENLELANRLNEKSQHTVFGITQFMDLTKEEFKNHYTGLKVPPPTNLTDTPCTVVTDSQIPDYNAPESHDWRTLNAVTRVKNQYQCGGCYAFSTSGNIEGQYAIKHGSLVEFSEQQTIDCDGNSNGCNGGYMATAFRSIIQQGGIESEADYPYEQVQQSCQFTPGKAAARLTDCTLYAVNSQEKLKQILYKVGPISIGLQSDNFRLYRGGVFLDQDCNYGQVDHAVLLVGYGTTDGMDYWIIKNSWDVTFGEQGYIKIQRGENALSCGMMNNGLMASSTVM